MYQEAVNHPLNWGAQPLGIEVYEAMFEIFEQVCTFWDNLANPHDFKSRLFIFMDNRISLRPEYKAIYVQAQRTMADLVDKLGREEAYRTLFTDKIANQSPPRTPLALVRQKVSNEFIAFQVSQGGFKAFSGAINYPSFIAGAFIPGEPAPYRTGGKGQ
ncbi:hypothetical protein [Massilia sp.]|uniref:hypothetical protein n=1 Tax=Massilia sp. TaxID=1882437 RepID=UPI00352E665F